MSGFDAQWLALREPEDHRVRNARVARACAAALSCRASLQVLDLGCGAGSNLRALAPLLGRTQAWRLVDHDAALLGVARERLAAWADSARPVGDTLCLAKDGKTLTVTFERRDLARDFARDHDAPLSPAPDLVTAAALFDLVSKRWIDDCARALAARRIPLLAALTYDGRMAWTPPHPADADARAAFHAHMARDKGFGPAAGPAAAAALRAALSAHGYRVVAGASDWRLPAGAPLARATRAGVAAAAVEYAAETDRWSAEALVAWGAAGEAAETLIGHTDLFAAPEAR